MAEQKPYHDLNGPFMAEKYERFLSLLVVAGLKDRLRAMKILRAENIEEAITVLEDCKLTDEHATEKASDSIKTALRLIGVCAAGVDNNKAAQDIRETLETEVHVALHDALIAIGAEVVDERGVYRDTAGNATS